MLQVNNLFFAYDKANILTSINLTINTGEFTCLLGPNGSGKTTLLKCINGLYKPQRGNVYCNDLQLKQLNKQQIARLISTVPQNSSLIFNYRVLDIVLMGRTPYLRLGKLPERGAEDKALQLLKNLGIDELANRGYQQLSGGERQLVMIARALLQDTNFIIMDEPTAQLDLKNKYLIMQELRLLAKKGKGIIVALHDPVLARSFCQKVVVLKKGQVIAEGKAAEVFTTKVMQETYELDQDILKSQGF